MLPPWLDVLLDLKYETDLVDVMAHPWDDLDEAHKVLSHSGSHTELIPTA